MKDRLGVEIRPGDYIAYSGTAGRSSVLHIGRVIESMMRPDTYWQRKDKLIEKLKVELLEEGFGEEPYSTKYKGKPKYVYLMFPERMIVVNHYIPKKKEK